MNIKIDLNISANEELANALLTLAAVMHNTIPNNTETNSDVVEEKDIKNKSADVTEDTEIENSKQEEIAITLEEVRTKLAALSQAGKQVEVKALIKKFGANKLTEIAKENYTALLKEAEEI